MTRNRPAISKLPKRKCLSSVMKSKKSRSDPRAHILTKQLKDFGKVGGIIDRRVSAQGSSVTSDDAALRRHIIEKLRKMETLGTTSAGEDDPLMRAARSGKKEGQRASYDDELGGLSADVVESELFAGGLFTQATVANGESRSNKHDSLLEKIFQTKEERLKRVEENEAQRKKLKDADSEWADRVRFMLSKLANLKPKNTKSTTKMESGRNEVQGLLARLTASSTKSIPPIGAKVETDAIKSERLLANLQSIVSIKMANSASVDGKNQTLGVRLTSVPEVPKREDIILRLLCNIGAYEASTVARMACELRNLVDNSLAHALRGLLLIQIILTDVVKRKIRGGSRERERFPTVDRLTGSFIPEIPQFLVRLFNSALDEGGLLYVAEDASTVEDAVYSTLDVDISLGEKPIPSEAVSVTRLGCLDRCITLLIDLIDVYAANFPAPSVARMFSNLPLNLESRLPTDRLPVGTEVKVKQLVERLCNLRSQPRPLDIVVKDRISLVLAHQDATPQALQKVGLVPLLEPQFDEKLDARRPKKKSSTTELHQKLTKERRGVARELRRDAQFLANYDLKRTKTCDDMRKRKTRAIIASMRCID